MTNEPTLRAPAGLASGDTEPDPLVLGLERSCARPAEPRDWMRTAPDRPGLLRLEAFFGGEAYAPHRHDTYSVGYTLRGVQNFSYRGSALSSAQGHVMVLHPDEVHDGHAGVDTGFLYRMIYIEPALIRAALGDTAAPLPFVRDAVFSDPRVVSLLQSIFADMETPLDPLQRDHLVCGLADALAGNDRSLPARARPKLDVRAIEATRNYLNDNLGRAVRSQELEDVTQHDRYSLARQFRAALGTSPYRYLVMRRLDHARAAIAAGASLADAAAASGFSDQAHMTRQFAQGFGLTPGRWRQLHTSAQGDADG
ncbi:AraC family transcriptional regulator [Stappia sp.]|uniref:AraC family transcriptional regulator n=1 Tax=Stappia sp. TaxID=1870903 RepID=UPI0025F1B182|nr:AraC family transcriptional regulator [Stappia sp.]